MSYIHFGRIGDIWKHLPLAEFLGLEKPRTYVETNSGSATYALSATPEQQYGVYSFFNNCKKSPLLSGSAYYRCLANHSVWENQLKLYLGSPALALCLLKENDTRFQFYDLDRQALDNLRQYACGQGMEKRCRFLNRDSLRDIGRQIKQLGPGDFIHFDPYEAFTPGEDGASYLDLFFAAARHGIKALFWYGYMTRQEKSIINANIHKQIHNSGLDKDIHCIEVYLKEIQEEEVIVNPGIVGSGLITANITSVSCNIFTRMASELVKIYKGTHVFEKFNGELEADIINP